MKKTIIPRILTFTLILALFLSSNAIAAKSMLDVKDIGFYLDDFLVLYKDGTVDGKGFYTSECLSWSGVSSIRVNSGRIIGLKSDNSIPYLYDRSLKLELDSDWKNIVMAAVGDSHAIGLREDGTWVSAGEYRNGECDVDDWTDIVDIGAGNGFTVGLKSDGTVVATGKNDKGQCNVSEWKGIVKISVGYNHVVGLCSDGKVVATGEDDNDECFVGRWKNVIDIDANHGVTLGLTSEGKILITNKRHAALDGYSGHRQIPENATFKNAKRIVGNDFVIAIFLDDGTIDIYGDNGEGACDFFEKTESSNNKEETLSEDKCKDIAIEYLNKYLKNPSSLQIHNTTCTKDGDKYLFIFDYSAMNSFGGYTRSTYYCMVDSKDGEVTLAYSN